MSDFAWPWMWLLLPLPWVLARWRDASISARGAIRWPHWDDLAGLGSTAVAQRRPSFLVLLCWLLACCAAARPVSWSEIAPSERSGRELMLAVDVSGSMAADDMIIGGQRVDRLTAVKAVAGDFLSRRQGDRVGLILFGQQAYLLTPLTLDLASVRYQLETSAIGLAGRETAIGDAIGLAVKRLRERDPAERLLVLLTDGVNTAGALAPERAAQLAADNGLRIHTIGMGSEGGSGPSLFGLSLPAAGAEIDEAMLEAIAAKTGGRYFRARNSRELVEIYAEIDRLEPLPDPGPTVRLQHELFPWPLGAALACLLLLLRPARAGSMPNDGRAAR